MFTGVLLTEKHGETFTGELKGGTVSKLKHSLKFLSGVRLLTAEFSLVRPVCTGEIHSLSGD